MASDVTSVSVPAVVRVAMPLVEGEARSRLVEQPFGELKGREWRRSHLRGRDRHAPAG